jgi:ATP-dependent Lhr-like helicase
MRHRLGIGVIVSDSMLQVKFLGGARLGLVEEYFVSRLKPGDVFSFAGRNVEFVRIKEMTVYVKKSTKSKGYSVSWQGGRMPLSSQLSKTIRYKLDEYYDKGHKDVELQKLEPLFEEQKRRSHLPHKTELLIEQVKTREGYHVFIYPFEGRNVHEGLSALFAYRLAQIKPLSFSLAFNDYGFELLSDQEIPLEEALQNGLLDNTHLADDIQKSVNISEMAKRKFRDIASIAGLVFTGYPGKQVKTRHVQASSQLFFSVFQDNEKDNLLLLQAYDEVFTFQMEQVRMYDALQRMQNQKIIIRQLSNFSPFCFPILTERFREKLSNEKLEDRIQKMLKQLNK